ncbi:MAG: hypothetical protein NT040_02965 [Bacteroidetes bacterium]|nr:hypothetical protein [Bacteroidota bacterium]
MPILRKPLPHFVIISGSGKKVGKTFMATAVIRSFSEKFPLLALKISPHVHDSLGNTTLVAEGEGFRIFRDLAPHHKNSGQFLEAGALLSFFMETGDVHLAEAIEVFMAVCNPMNRPVICESGALGNLCEPGISIFISHPDDNLPAHKLTSMRLSDLVIPAKLFSTPGIIDRILFTENKWHLLPA